MAEVDDVEVAPAADAVVELDFSVDVLEVESAVVELAVEVLDAELDFSLVALPVVLARMPAAEFRPANPEYVCM